MSWGVNYEEAWDFEFLFIVLGTQLGKNNKEKMRGQHMVENCRLRFNSLHGEVSCTYLLCDAASFALLHVRLPDLRAKRRQHGIWTT